MEILRNSANEEKIIKANKLPIKPRPYLSKRTDKCRKKRTAYISDAAIISNQRKMFSDECITAVEIFSV